jgi:tagatose 6-phosphate kinase
MMLVTCLNPAVDVTYTVDALTPGASHRVRTVTRRAGGKGINVARVARLLEHSPLVVGLAGEAGSAVFVPQLSRDGISSDFVHVDGESRQTVTVVDEAGATVLNEPGPRISPREWIRFVALFVERATSAEVVVLSGSLPPGVPRSAYAELTAKARRLGAAVIVDADGEPLRKALAAGPEVVKPNAAEAAALLGRPVESAKDARDAAEALCADGARAAIVSLGPLGLVATAYGTSYRVRLPEPVSGNPTGAGDALVAAVACGLLHGRALREVLCDAVAVSAAAVAIPYAGAFDRRLAHRLRRNLIVEEF